MIDGNLAKAIIHCALFFEFSNEEILNQDAAIEAFEQLAFHLQQLPADVNADLIMRFDEVAGDYGDKAEFVKGLAAAMDLL